MAVVFFKAQEEGKKWKVNLHKRVQCLVPKGWFNHIWSGEVGVMHHSRPTKETKMRNIDGYERYLEMRVKVVYNKAKENSNQS